MKVSRILLLSVALITVDGLTAAAYRRSVSQLRHTRENLQAQLDGLRASPDANAAEIAALEDKIYKTTALAFTLDMYIPRWRDMNNQEELAQSEQYAAQLNDELDALGL